MVKIAEWRVLLVDDEPDTLFTVREILAASGVADVQEATDGEECVAMLDTALPNLILLDLRMPRMDGWQTLQAIRQHPALASVPVAAITAYHSVAVEREAYAAGFDAYFPKPFTAAEFIGGLDALMN